MKSMVYDIITVGSAMIDVFLRSKSKDVELRRLHKGHDDVCLPLGGKVLVDELKLSAGGGGLNAAVGFSRLGFKTGFVGKFGWDINGRIIERTLFSESVSFLGARGGTTGYGVILGGVKKDRVVLAFKGVNDSLLPSDVELSGLKTKWLYIGTLMSHSWDTLKSIAAFARRKNIPVAFNPSFYLCAKGLKFVLPVLKCCKVLVLNKEEAFALTGGSSLRNSLRKLQNIVPIVVITDGARGATAFDGFSFESIVPKRVSVVDSTGAGDAFACGFVSGLMWGADLSSCLRFGASNAQGVIRSVGAQSSLLSRSKLLKNASHSGRVVKNASFIK